MRVIIKMSIIQGSGLNGNWGLVRQVGPWKPTRRDRVGAGYTQGNEDVIRPYVVRGDKPPPKLSHWAQRSIVSKKAYDNGFRKSVPGMRYNAVSSSLLGISNTMLGIGARGSGGGVSQGNQNIDVNGKLGNDYGEEAADEEASIKSEIKSEIESPGTMEFNNFLGNLEMIQQPVEEEEFFDAEEGEDQKRQPGIWPQQQITKDWRIR